jgi:membrane protease YdiL (CAAX protease family)
MRGRSILEVLIVFALMTALGWALAAWMAPLNLGTELQRWINGAVFIAFSMILMALTRRPLAEFGLTLRDWRASLQSGMTGYLARFLPLGALTALLALGVAQPHATWVGAGLLGLAGIAAIAVLLAALARQDARDPGGEQRRARARSNLIVLGGLLLVPILAGAATGRLSVAVVSTVAWQFVVSGFGEEMRYRGYYQSRVNQEFGRPWRLLGVPFGPGLIVASLLFGLSHAFNTFNPLLGQMDLAWPWAAWTVIGGLLFGLLREKTGDIIACGIAHGGPDAVGEALASLFGWTL